MNCMHTVFEQGGFGDMVKAWLADELFYPRRISDYICTLEPYVSRKGHPSGPYNLAFPAKSTFQIWNIN